MRWVKLKRNQRGERARYHAIGEPPEGDGPGFTYCGLRLGAGGLVVEHETDAPDEDARCATCLTNILRVENKLSTPFREAVRKHAAQRGISHTFLAKRLGMTRQQFSQILDRGSCTMSKFREIASVLDIRASRLLADIEVEEACQGKT